MEPFLPEVGFIKLRHIFLSESKRYINICSLENLYYIYIYIYVFVCVCVCVRVRVVYSEI